MMREAWTLSAALTAEEAMDSSLDMTGFFAPKEEELPRPAHIQPQVAPAQHDGICLLGNGLEVEQGLPRLTLGNQLHGKQIVDAVQVVQ
ncbi:MAG: hypothetical protein FRX49_01407 [Trebouxia sp. A1-2]|nr:MAG: hypothetical protein FRX49_01407 [Trebouxia sp. A1-2]